MTVNSLFKLKVLQEQRKKILEKIEKNEECWPGHSSTRYQTAYIDRQVLIEHLKSIEEEIKKLNHV